MTERRDPADFRWSVEKALDARTTKTTRPAWTSTTCRTRTVCPTPTLAALLRSRMTVLTESGKPPAPHGGEDAHHLTPQTLTRVAVAGPRRGRTAAAKPPAKRRKSVTVKEVTPHATSKITYTPGR